jgi:tetratricopeptide (TPR) repeat protein
MDEQNSYDNYTLLVASPDPLKIDVGKLRERLSVEAVSRDLESFGLDTPAGFLDTFLCSEEKLRLWCGNGPINTDDLPFTQYETGYSKGAEFKTEDFFELMEDIWPYLTNTGNQFETENLREKLLLRAKAVRLTMQKRLSEAYTLLPDDIRYRKMRRIYEETALRYCLDLFMMYRNDPKFLDFIISTMPYSKVMAPVYERTLNLNPKSVTALAALGIMRIETKSWQEAENYLRQAVRLKPSYGTARFKLGVVLDNTGRHAEALKQWKEAATTTKNAASANQLGVCLLDEGRFEEAIPWFRLAMDIDPTSKIPRLNLARVLSITGRTDEAKIHLNYVLKIDPEDKEALMYWQKWNSRAEPPSQSSPVPDGASKSQN